MARFPRFKAGLDGLASVQGAGGAVLWLVLVIGTALKGFEWPIVLLVAILGLAGILLTIAAAAYLFHSGETSSQAAPAAPAFYQTALADLERTNARLQDTIKEVTLAKDQLFGAHHLLLAQSQQAEQMNKSRIEVLTRQLTDRSTRGLRVLWNRKGRTAVDQALSLIETVLNKIRDPHVAYRDLLSGRIRGLDRGRNMLSVSLADDTTVSLEQIRFTFGEVFGTYYDILRWVATIRDTDAAPFTDDKLAAELTNWKKAHHMFMVEAERLTETPEHRETIGIWPHHGADRRLFTLLREAHPDA